PGTGADKIRSRPIGFAGQIGTSDLSAATRIGCSTASRVRRSSMHYAPFFTLLLAFGAVAPSSSQDVVVDVNLRTVVLSVEDERGRPVIDLKPDDFVVVENGQAKPVAHLSLETHPVAMG